MSLMFPDIRGGEECIAVASFLLSSSRMISSDMRASVLWSADFFDQKTEIGTTNFNDVFVELFCHLNLKQRSFFFYALGMRPAPLVAPLSYLPK